MDGIRILDLPDLGSVTDDSLLVGDHAGSGTFSALALRRYLGQGLSVLDFGGAGDGVTDCSEAWAEVANLAVAQLGGAVIFFPPGNYRFDNALGITLPAGRRFNLRIIGYGAQFYFPLPDAGLFVFCSMPSHRVAVEGALFTTAQAGTVVGLTLQQSSPLGAFSPSVLRDLVFCGSDNLGVVGAEYWGLCVDVVNSSGTRFDNVACYGSSASNGNGIQFRGTGVGGPSGSNYAIYHDLRSVIGNNLANGVIHGTYAQDVRISQSCFQNTTTGVLVGGSEAGLFSLTIADSKLSCTTPVVTLTNVGALKIANCDISGGASQSSLALDQVTCVDISNSLIFAGAGGAGIALSNSTGPTAITGSSINGGNIGLNLAAGVQNATVTGNTFTNNTFPIIEHNAHGNHIANNLGVAAQVGPVTPGTSPWTYVASSRPEMLVLTSDTTIGDVTSTPGNLSLLPHPTAANENLTLMLLPNQQIVVTFAGSLGVRTTLL